MCFIAGVSPAAASTGTRARGPPLSRAPRGPASVGGIRVKPFFLGFNVSSIRTRLTVRRIPRHFVVKKACRSSEEAPVAGELAEPSRSAHWPSSARSTVITRPSRSSERRRDPSKTLLSGVQRQQYSRAAHRPPNTASFRRKRPAAPPKRRPLLGNKPSPTAASVGPRAHLI